MPQVPKKMVFRAGHPDLSARFFQPLKQRHPPRWIEMGGHFVEQEHGRLTPMRANQRRMREQDGKEQRLLLAG